MTASRTSAVAFTALTAFAGLELAATAWWMPWPRLTLLPATLTTCAAVCAAHEWTALQQQAETDRTPR